jgi:predicted anti-sigma-YlaC factor YlaD
MGILVEMTPAGEFTCKEMVEVMTEYLDGTLAPADHARFEAHLAGCRGCRAYLGQVRRTIGLLGTLKPETDAPVPEDTKRRLVDVFRALQRP